MDDWKALPLVISFNSGIYIGEAMPVALEMCLHEAETIHIVAGRFSMEVDGVKSVLEPGDTVHVPIGAVHSGGNVGLETGTRVVIFSPAGLERLFLEIGAAAPGTPADVPALVAAAAAHGFVFV